MLRFLGLFAMILLMTAPCFASTDDAGLIADFDEGKAVNTLGREVEVWLKEDGNDETQSCRMGFVEEDALGSSAGMALKIDYDVDSPNPAYNGIRMDLTGFDASPYDTLNFYVKGDDAAGFSPKLKIELIGSNGRPSPYIVDGVTSEWQKVSVPLDQFFLVKDWSAVQKFVVVFADITNEPKEGTVYLDHVYFSKG